MNQRTFLPNGLFSYGCSIFKKVASWKGKRTKVTPTYVKKMAAFWLKRSTSPHQSFSDQGMSCRILMENTNKKIEKKCENWVLITLNCSMYFRTFIYEIHKKQLSQNNIHTKMKRVENQNLYWMEMYLIILYS